MLATCRKCGGNFTYPIALKFTESGAPVANRAIVIAGLATVSPEEHSLIIRDVPPDERDQFRIDWNVRSKI